MSDMFDMDEFDRHPADEEPRDTGGSKRNIRQHTQSKMPTLEECQIEVQSRIWSGTFKCTSSNVTEIVYKFICRHIGCA